MAGVDHLVRASSGTFLDSATGLQWVAFSIGQSQQENGGYAGEAKLFSWQQLKPLLKKINHGKGFSGQHDWRIPTVKEIEALIAADENNHVFTVDDELEFWTQDSHNDAHAWAITAISNTPISKPKTEKAAIRLVRTAKPANTQNHTQAITSLVTNNASNAIKQSRAAISSAQDKGLASIQNSEHEQRVAQARETISLYRLFWTRVLKSDFSVVRANKKEAEALAAEEIPVLSPIALDYSSWRRSLLMISLLGLTLGLFLRLPSIFDSNSVTWVIQIQQLALFFIQAGTALLCFLAAKSWSNLAKSRSLARLAWLAQFVLPLVIFLLPFSFFIEEKMLLVQIGLAALLALAPKVFGLFPGLIRCSLTMKTLLPESSVSGWLAIIIAPLYMLLLFIAAIVALQLTEVFLAAGLVLFSISLSIVIFKSEKLQEAQSQTDASSSIRSIKTR